MGNGRSSSEYILPITIFSVPFGAYSFETGMVNISPPNVLILVTFMIFAIVRFRHKAIRLTPSQVTVIVLFTFLLVLQSVATTAHSGNPRRLVTYFGYFLFMTAIFVYVESVKDVQRLLIAAFLSAVTISVLTIIHVLLYPTGLPFGQQYSFPYTIAGFTFPFQPSLGVDVSYGVFGMLTMIATPYFAYVGLEKRSQYILSGVSVVLVAVILSQSRSTWVATCLAMIILVTGYMAKSRRGYVRYTAIAVPIVAVMVALPVASVLISARPETLWMRIDQYRYGVDIMLSSPLLGVGFGNLGMVDGNTIHSAFVTVGARTGVLSLLIVTTVWLMAFLFLVRGMYSSHSKYVLAIGLMASLAVMLIESNLQPGFSKAPWIVLAIALSTNRVISPNKNLKKISEESPRSVNHYSVFDRSR